MISSPDWYETGSTLLCSVIVVHPLEGDLSEEVDFKEVWPSNGTLKYLKIQVNIIPYGRLTLTTLGTIAMMFNDKKWNIILDVSLESLHLHESCFKSS